MKILYYCSVIFPRHASQFRAPRFAASALSSTLSLTWNSFITRPASTNNTVLRPSCGNNVAKNQQLRRCFSSSSGTKNDTAAADNTTSAISNDRVVITIDPINSGIAHVVLNRAEKLNALDMEMFRAIKDAALKVMSDKTVRVVILRGQGRAFCTGLDVPSIVKHSPLRSTAELLERRPRPGMMTEATPTKTPHHDNDVNDAEAAIIEPNLIDAAAAVSATTNLAQDVGYLWRQVPVPVICCLHGMCYGGGLQIALGADIRLATADCKLSVMESVWGLIPDMSATVTLRELVRIDVAKELTFTGRIVTGKEAAELGLVTRCVPDPLAEAVKLAESLVQKSPDALRLTKQLYQSTWVSASEEYCLRVETDFQRKLLLSWNQMAAAGRNFGLKLPYFLTKHHHDDDVSPPPPR